MEDIERLISMITGQAKEAMEHCAKRADYTNPRDAEHIVKLMKIMYYGKCLDPKESYAMGAYQMDGGVEPGRAYRGRDAMGRYTSAADRMYSRAGSMMYEDGYSGHDRDRMQDLIRELDAMRARVGPNERATIDRVTAMLNA